MKLLILLIIISSCSTSPTYESSTAPTWLADAGSYCGDKYLCGVGEGKSIKVSDARARAEISKIFQTEIVTELKSSETFQTGSEVKENYFNEIIESSEQNLENVKILEHWKREGTSEVYSLAGLDKVALQNKITQQIDPLVKKLNNLVNTGRRSDLIRAKKIYPEIYPLIAQWRIVSDKEYIYSPKEKDFVQTAFSKFNRPIEIDFNWSGNSSLKPTISSYLKDLLLKNGYRFGKSINQYRLQGNIFERKIPIQIDGYIKKEFELNIDIFKKNKLVGNIHHHLKTSGRNWGQLSERARLTLMKVIFENLENLNIN